LQVDGLIDVGGEIMVGCGIIAIERIFSGHRITAGAGIQSLNGKIVSRSTIRAGRSVIAGREITVVDGSLLSGENIFAARSIDVSTDIVAGRSISANEQIKCLGGITAGRGITAGFSIDCKVISSEMRIMAGLCRFRLPQPEETEIRCEQLVKGDVAFGTLVQKFSA
jgi:hypothetical protein